jgi:hypothetical protein
MTRCFDKTQSLPCPERLHRKSISKQHLLQVVVIERSKPAGLGTDYESKRFGVDRSRMARAAVAIL